MSDDFPSLFRYFRWADDRLIAACRALPHDRYVSEPAPAWSSLRSTVVHLADSADIWSRRLINGVWPTTFRAETDLPTVEDAAVLLAEIHNRFDRYVAGLTRAHLEETFRYKSVAGGEGAAPRWAVLRHVVNHATYHRGQAASKIHMLGGQRPVTDLVLWAIDEITE